MTLVVRDEEDILPVNLDFHLGIGVDVVLAIDHGSTDGTTEILREYERRTGRVHWWRDDAREHDQARRVNHLSGLASSEYGAEWIMHGDADEFWTPAAGTLRDVFGAVPDRYSHLLAARHDFLPAADDGRPFHHRLVVRYGSSLNLRGTRLEPKVAQRPGAGLVEQGNHRLNPALGECAPDAGLVSVLHFPMRSYEQFERKVIRTGTGYEHFDHLQPGIGCDQLELLDRYRRGQLPDYYRSQLLDEAQVAAGLQAGELVLDTRLKTLLEPEPGDARSLEALLRTTWELAGSLEDSQGSLEESRAQGIAADARAQQQDARITDLEGQLAEVRAWASALERTLAVVRSSRLMRYSSPARRLYYRARRNGR